MLICMHIFVVFCHWKLTKGKKVQSPKYKCSVYNNITWRRKQNLCLMKYQYEECCSQKHYRIAPVCFLPAQLEHSFSLSSIIDTYHYCVQVSSPLNKYQVKKRSRSPLKCSPSHLMFCDPCFVRVAFLIYTIYSLRAGNFRKTKGWLTTTLVMLVVGNMLPPE